MFHFADPDGAAHERLRKRFPTVESFHYRGAASGFAEAGGNFDKSAAGLAFYPFADFSPELAALRWARRNDVPVVCCDLPLSSLPRASDRVVSPSSGPSLWAAVHRTVSGRAGDDLWDRWVEAAAPGSPPEAVRRAALRVAPPPDTAG